MYFTQTGELDYAALPNRHVDCYPLVRQAGLREGGSSKLIQTIAYCQYYTGYLPLEFVIDQRRLKFLNNICNLNNVVIHSLFRLNGATEISSLIAKYNTNMFDIKSIKYSMWNSFILVNNLGVE